MGMAYRLMVRRAKSSQPRRHPRGGLNARGRLAAGVRP
jgi:hypothetical protein